jgi:hypothetical protein
VSAKRAMYFQLKSIENAQERGIVIPPDDYDYTEDFDYSFQAEMDEALLWNY